MDGNERLGIYRAYVRTFGIDPRKKERRDGPPGQHWTPRRSCFRDWLISAYVVRWGREAPSPWHETWDGDRRWLPLVLAGKRITAKVFFKNPQDHTLVDFTWRETT